MSQMSTLTIINMQMPNHKISLGGNRRSFQKLQFDTPSNKQLNPLYVGFDDVIGFECCGGTTCFQIMMFTWLLYSGSQVQTPAYNVFVCSPHPYVMHTDKADICQSFIYSPHIFIFSQFIFGIHCILSEMRYSLWEAIIPLQFISMLFTYSPDKDKFHLPRFHIQQHFLNSYLQISGFPPQFYEHFLPSLLYLNLLFPHGDAF